jgi:WD40 repeat protein
LWDTGTATEIGSLTGHEFGVDSVAFSSDGKRLAGGSAFSRPGVRIWDTENGTEIGFLITDHAAENVAFSPDGKLLASGGSGDGSVRIVDVGSGIEIACLRGHKNFVRVVAFSPEGKCLASGSADKTVRLWDARNGAEIMVLRGHTKEVQMVAFSPDGRRLASGASDKTIRLWDTESGQCLEIIEGIGDVSSVAAGEERFPCRAFQYGLETVIELAATRKQLAWFPAPLDHITTHPLGCTWAGATDNHLYLVTLEGRCPTQRRCNTPPP